MTRVPFICVIDRPSYELLSLLLSLKKNKQSAEGRGMARGANAKGKCKEDWVRQRNIEFKATFDADEVDRNAFVRQRSQHLEDAGMTAHEEILRAQDLTDVGDPLAVQ